MMKKRKRIWRCVQALSYLRTLPQIEVRRTYNQDSPQPPPPHPPVRAHSAVCSIASPAPESASPYLRHPRSRASSLSPFLASARYRTPRIFRRPTSVSLHRPASNVLNAPPSLPLLPTLHPSPPYFPLPHILPSHTTNEHIIQLFAPPLARPGSAFASPPASTLKGHRPFGKRCFAHFSQ